MNAVAEMTDVIPSPIIFTDSAAQKVAQLIEEEGNPDLKLRVFVQGGGCSGFQYGFTFDEIVNEDDTSKAPSSSSRTRPPRPPAAAARRSRSKVSPCRRRARRVQPAGPVARSRRTRAGPAVLFPFQHKHQHCYRHLTRPRCVHGGLNI
jgi:hypothetical protein